MSRHEPIRVVIEPIGDPPHGFEAGIESKRMRSTGYYGKTEGDALLSMMLFQVEYLRNSAEAAGLLAREVEAIAQVVAEKLTTGLNPNLRLTVSEATGQFGSGGGELERARRDNEALRERLRQAIGVEATCATCGAGERVLPEEKSGWSRCCGAPFSEGVGDER